jgi:hypothetical protein
VFTLILITISSEGQADEAWLHSNKTFFFRIVDGALNRKEISGLLFDSIFILKSL